MPSIGDLARPSAGPERPGGSALVAAEAACADPRLLARIAAVVLRRALREIGGEPLVDERGVGPAG
jgi:hypothetical protein